MIKFANDMTIQEIITRKEDQTFDCKSIQIDPKALAVPIVAMANADGGVLAREPHFADGNPSEYVSAHQPGG